jgi:hypothetical protein
MTVTRTASGASSVHKSTTFEGEQKVMNSEKIQQLSDEIKLKLSESLSNLSEVFQKYGISEGVQVEFKIDPSKLQSSDAPLNGKIREVLLETEFHKASIESIEAEKVSLKKDDKLQILLACRTRRFAICPTGNHPNGGCWHCV